MESTALSRYQGGVFGDLTRAPARAVPRPEAAGLPYVRYVLVVMSTVSGRYLKLQGCPFLCSIGHALTDLKRPRISSNSSRPHGVLEHTYYRVGTHGCTVDIATATAILRIPRHIVPRT